jgi:ribosomal protein L11 methyltransferase
VFLQLSFDLGQLDAEATAEAADGCGAYAVTFVDAADDPVLEPGPGEVRLWPATRVRCLFAEHSDRSALVASLSAAVGVEPDRIEVEEIGDRVWEREWLRDFRPLRFGRRLWVRPHHEVIADPGAVVVALDPGLAFGTGTHASTAQCMGWLDAFLEPGALVIDYGCGSGILGLAAAKLGAAAVHAYDIDPQALIATHDNAVANGVAAKMHLHQNAETLPAGADVLLANILSGPLCALAQRFATLVRPGGSVVLAGLMHGEAADVTGAYAAWFDVTRFAERDGWVCLSGRRRAPNDSAA